ncbi:MAG TPA: peptidylprolyl isomerase [Acidobacteriota bacterium]|nr:peptidylprolyl isomerase [Acidobacteriota bacterium]
MALKWLRNNFKRLKFVLWFVIITLAASMLVFFVNPPDVGSGLYSGDVARVGEFRISREDYGRQYRMLMERFRPYLEQNPQFAQQLGLKQQALSVLISNYAMLVEAERLGITVTSDEVVHLLSQIPAFMENGQFIGRARYQEVLRANNMTPRSFETGLRSDIVETKLRHMLTDSLQVGEGEVRDQFVKQNQEARVRYVHFNSEEVRPEEIDEEALTAFYQSNLQDYTAPEQRRAKTLSVQVQPTEVEVSEEEIAAHLPQSDPNSIRLSHILFAVGDAEVEEVRQEAQKVLDEIKEGANFAAMAAQHSDDAGSANKGGDLGFVRRGEREEAFEQAAFALQNGETTDQLVRTSAGFHIIRKTDVENSQARAIARFNAQRQKANEQTQQLASRISAQLENGADLETAAAEHGLQVATSDWFSRGESVPGTVASTEFSAMVFDLAQPGQVTPVYNFSPNQYLFAELLEIRPPQARPLEEVREEIETRFRQQEGRKLAEAKADEFLEKARQEGVTFEEAAEQMGVTVTATEYFKNNTQQTVDDVIQFSPLIVEEAFKMEPGEMGGPARVRENFVVFQLIEKSPIDEEKFEQDKDNIRRNLLDQRRNQFFAQYMTRVIDRLEAQGEIERNLALVDEITG